MLEPRPFAIRVSPRARRIRLTVSPADGLVVVVPPGVPQRRVEEAVRERREWIDRALARVAEHAGHLSATAELPATIDLRATGERLDVGYSTGRRRVVERAGELVVCAADEAECHEQLARWLHAAALRRLPPLLEDVAEEHRLTYESTRVRGQRTRWASRSRRGSVSLNRSLLFLPPELVRYVMLHELVHGIHFDHSPAFWNEMASRDPHSRAMARRMRDAWRYVPGWATRR